jgi:hypothetical protein
VGQSHHFDGALATSGLTRLADILSVSRHISNVPERTHALQQKGYSITSSAEASSVVGNSRPSAGLKIDDKFKFSGLLDRQIGRLDPLEHLPHIDARFSVHIGEVRTTFRWTVSGYQPLIPRFAITE